MASSLKVKAGVKVPNRNNYSDLKLCDVQCPICFRILVEPVLMPCTHVLCMPCFNQNVSESSLSCPMCRLRISTWARKATREKKLIDKKLWEAIQKTFPDEVRLRIYGLDEPLVEEEVEEIVQSRHLSKPGEIRLEYEEQLRKLTEEEEQRRMIELRASEELIRRLEIKEQEEAKRRKYEQRIIEKKDMKIAKALSDKLDTMNTTDDNVVHDFLDELNQVMEDEVIDLSIQHSFTTPVTKEVTITTTSAPDIIPDKIVKAEESQSGVNTSKGITFASDSSRSLSAESHDSIALELCHFKPIKVAPKTPPKRLPDGRIVEPCIIHTTPRNLNFCEANLKGDNSILDSPVFSQRLRLVMENKLTVIMKKSQSTETDQALSFSTKFQGKTSTPSKTDASGDDNQPLIPLEPNLPIADQTSIYSQSFAKHKTDHDETKENYKSREVKSKAESNGQSSKRKRGSSTDGSDRSSSTNLNVKMKKKGEDPGKEQLNGYRSISSSTSASTSSNGKYSSNTFHSKSSATVNQKDKRDSTLCPLKDTKKSKVIVTTLNIKAKCSKSEQVLDSKEETYLSQSQKAIFNRLKQEEADYLFARKLQQELDNDFWLGQNENRPAREPYCLRPRQTALAVNSRRKYR